MIEIVIRMEAESAPATDSDEGAQLMNLSRLSASKRKKKTCKEEKSSTLKIDRNTSQIEEFIKGFIDLEGGIS